MRATTIDVPDVFTKAKRSAVMARIRGKGNKGTELRMIALMRALRAAGWRVIRVWECDLAVKHWPRVARRLKRALVG